MASRSPDAGLAQRGHSGNPHCRGHQGSAARRLVATINLPTRLAPNAWHPLVVVGYPSVGGWLSGRQIKSDRSVSPAER